MEPAHRAKLARAFPAALRGKRVVCPGLADDYGLMAPELVRVLWDRVPPGRARPGGRTPGVTEPAAGPRRPGGRAG